MSEKTGFLKRSAGSPRVSIGMPVYNGDRFIREALDSLIQQTFTDFELIISDNASTDGTQMICREYAVRDPRIVYMRQKENQGAYANFQLVLDQAKGEFFMWAAADDLQYPEFIQNLVCALEEDTSLCCIMTDVENTYNASTQGPQVSLLDDIRLDDVKKRWEKIRPHFFRNPTSNIYFCAYGLFRINTIRDVDLNYRNMLKYAFSSEIPLLAQIAVRGPIASIPIALKIYRKHEDSIYHIEQKIISQSQRFLGSILVNKALFFIIYESKIAFFEKINLFGVVFISTIKFFGGFLKISICELLDRIMQKI